MSFGLFSSAATDAIGSATLASIFFDVFSLAIPQPRADSTATVFNACYRKSSAGYAFKFLPFGRLNRFWLQRQ